ncbi:MAG: AzlD domain-containing protein [Lachnospiraceae bacterium]|nr:AzlD domain-containing protein [Lachnospiraceae bacterium]
MNNTQFFIYLLIMAGSTYLIRAIPFAMVKEKTENKIVKSFLTYIPYAVLSAMTLPAVFYAPNSIIAAVFGVLVAVALSLKNKGLLFVAVFSCLAVFVAEYILKAF